MLLTDTEALEKANEIIKEIDKSAVVADYFWLQAENREDDIFCYYVLVQGDDIPYPPGMSFPLFKRNGDMTDFILPIPGYIRG